MKKRMILMLLLISLFGVGSFFSGCKKKDSTSSVSVDTETASDDALADNTFTDVDNIGSEAVLNAGVNKTGGTYFYINTQCATISFDSTSKPGTWVATINFGTTGCVCIDGKTRSGEIIVTWTGGRYMQKNTVINYTFKNYVVNGYKVAGSKTVTNLGPNSSGQPQWHIVVSGGQITRPSDGAVATYSSDRIRTWTVGYNILFFAYLDQFTIANGYNTVTDSGNSFKGVAYTVTISTPLTIAFDCKYFITSGVLNLTAGTNNATINYGANCSPTIIATINGKSYTINRP